MVSLGSLSSFLVQLPGLAVTLTCQGHTSCKALIFALIFLPCLQILRMPLLYSVRSSGSMTTITDLQYLQQSLILSNVSVFLLMHLLFSIFARRGKHFIHYCFIHIIQCRGGLNKLSGLIASISLVPTVHQAFLNNLFALGNTNKMTDIYRE